jgi:hypothetical protein
MKIYLFYLKDIRTTSTTSGFLMDPHNKKQFQSCILYCTISTAMQSETPTFKLLNRP